MLAGVRTSEVEKELPMINARIYQRQKAGENVGRLVGNASVEAASFIPDAGSVAKYAADRKAGREAYTSMSKGQACAHRVR